MTGTCNNQAGDYPVAFSSVDGSTRQARFCFECNNTHVYDFAKPSDMLHHDKCSAKMCKPTHVRLTKVYEVSLRMLRLERSCHSVSDWTIDSASLDLALEKSERDRGRLAASSHAVRNWPLPPIVDFSQSDPPYPGPEFNPDAGTYSGFWEEQEADQDLSKASLGDLGLIVDVTADVKTQPICETAVVTKASLSAASQAAIIPAQVTAEYVKSTAASPVTVTSGRSSPSGCKITSPEPKALVSESSGAGRSEASSSEWVIHSRTPVLAAQLPEVEAVPHPTSEAARTKLDDSNGVLAKIGQSISQPISLKEDKRTKLSFPTASATIDAQQPHRQALKAPIIKLDPMPAGASITEKALAESSLTKNVVAADSVSHVESAKTQIQTQQPAASSAITRLPAVKPTHPFKPGHIVWVSRREYEGENYNPLEHLRDLTNRPACVLSAKVPGRPDHVYICGVGT